MTRSKTVRGKSTVSVPVPSVISAKSDASLDLRFLGRVRTPLIRTILGCPHSVVSFLSLSLKPDNVSHATPSFIPTHLAPCDVASQPIDPSAGLGAVGVALPSRVLLADPAPTTGERCGSKTASASQFLCASREGPGGKAGTKAWRRGGLSFVTGGQGWFNAPPGIRTCSSSCSCPCSEHVTLHVYTHNEQAKGKECRAVGIDTSIKRYAGSSATSSLDSSAPMRSS